MHLLKSLFFTVFFLFAGLVTYAQTQPIFQKIDQSQGLSSSRITGIVKDKNGFVWISTQYGLNRYDGHRVKVYNKQNSNIPTNDINGLYLDSKNLLWLTSYGKGLILYKKENDKFSVYKNSLENPYSINSNRINTLIEDSSGNLWIGTEKGLSFFDIEKNQFYNYTFGENYPFNVMSLYKDSQSRLWVGKSSSGIFLFNQQTKQLVEINQELNSAINAICELNSDHILMATSGKGLLVLDMKNDRIYNYLENQKDFSKKTKIIRSMTKDAKGNLWLGTDGFGLYEVKNLNSQNPVAINYMQNVQQSFSLSGNAIYALTEDENANLWIGSAWNGINVLNNNRQTEIIFSDFKGVNPSPVLSIFENKQYIFLGLDGNGLNIYDKTTGKSYYFDEQKIKAKYIQKIMQTRDGKIWMGTFNNGLLKFDLKTEKVKQYAHNENDENSLSFNDVRDIIEDKNNNLWISTWGGGLNYLNTQTEDFKQFNIQNNNLISLLKEEDDLWITSYGGGLNVFNIESEQLETFVFDENDKNSISSNNVFSILKDSKGFLWIGTSGEGINRMDLKTKTIERFETDESVRYKTITSIVEDDDNNIWFGTKNGIIKYDYNTESFSVPSSLSGDYHINSVYKDEAGFLYFGGLKGVIKFNPNNLQDYNLHPKVVISDFKIFNKEFDFDENSAENQSLELTEKVTLKHFQDVITFEFAALKFPFSDNCEYAIKMENFDEDWRDIGKDRTVTYTNLYPGDYNFKVKSKVVGYEWDDDFTSMEITILKPFWLTWWAFAIYGLLFLLFLYVYRKISISYANLKSNLAFEKLTHQKDNELYQLKQQFFTNISHEIRTPVTLILSSINRLFETDQIQGSKPVKAAHTIRRNSSLLLRLVNELLDTRKLESKDIRLNVAENELVSFVKDIYLSFKDVATDRNISYIFKTESNSISLWFDKAQLEKVVFNLISNAFKFTDDSGKIEVYLENYTDDIILKVKDNGIGISATNLKKIFDKFYQVKSTHTPTNRGFGLGLSIVKDITELHQGKISVNSEHKKGSCFEVKLLKGHQHFEDIIENQNTHQSDKEIQHIENKLAEVKTNKTKILIVEDNLEIQESLKEVLEDEGYEIHQAYNGVEGLKKATLVMPDLIITDLMMPEMDGEEMAKKLKLNNLTSSIPIIIITAKATLEDQMQGFDTGADEYISKPYNEDFLKNRIKNLLKNRKILQKKFGNSVPNPKEANINSQDQQFLEDLYKLLENNLQTDELKAENIAEQMNMSHSAMYKKIKSLTGLTYMELVRDYRLSIAKQLIEELGYSVSEACYKVGYSDRKYFSKLFKQKFKKNPSEFLKS